MLTFTCQPSPAPQVVCGVSATAVLAPDGRLLVAGDNTDNRLGLDTETRCCHGDGSLLELKTNHRKNQLTGALPALTEPYWTLLGLLSAFFAFAH